MPNSARAVHACDGTNESMYAGTIILVGGGAVLPVREYGVSVNFCPFCGESLRAAHESEQVHDCPASGDEPDVSTIDGRPFSSQESLRGRFGTGSMRSIG